MNTSIANLRRSGYKVRVLHSRLKTYTKKMDGESFEYSAKGGNTTIEITTPEGLNIIGTAQCSMVDNWNRKIGNQIALGRAISQL